MMPERMILMFFRVFFWWMGGEGLPGDSWDIVAGGAGAAIQVFGAPDTARHSRVGASFSRALRLWSAYSMFGWEGQNFILAGGEGARFRFEHFLVLHVGCLYF
jgi:hypothetical protein